MNPMQNLLERAETLLAPWGDTAERPAPYRLDVSLGANDLLPAVAALRADGWGYLVAITGLDPGVATGQLSVLYHFAEGAAVVTLRVSIPRDTAELPTIRTLVPLAAIYEQELTEVLGVVVTGAPDNGRLFLPDDWPAGAYPLRKDIAIAQAETAAELQ